MMITQLKETLKAHILINHPEILAKLQADYSVTQFLDDRVSRVTQLLQTLLAQERPAYIIEELCLKAMTIDLRPSRCNYIKGVMADEFPADYVRLSQNGVLTYEVISLVEVCQEHFQTYGFTESTMNNRFLRYAVIIALHNHFN